MSSISYVVNQTIRSLICFLPLWPNANFHTNRVFPVWYLLRETLSNWTRPLHQCIHYGFHNPSFTPLALPSGNQGSELSLLHPKAIAVSLGCWSFWSLVGCFLKKINSANKTSHTSFIKTDLTTNSIVWNFPVEKVYWRVQKKNLKSVFRHLNKRMLISKALEYLLHCLFCWLFF